MYAGSVSPIPYGAKVRKLFRKQYLLNSQDEEQMFLLIDEGWIGSARQIVEYIDEHGEWLDG